MPWGYEYSDEESGLDNSGAASDEDGLDNSGSASDDDHWSENSCHNCLIELDLPEGEYEPVCAGCAFTLCDDCFGPSCYGCNKTAQGLPGYRYNRYCRRCVLRCPNCTDINPSKIFCKMHFSYHKCKPLSHAKKMLALCNRDIGKQEQEIARHKTALRKAENAMEKLKAKRILAQEQCREEKSKKRKDSTQTETTTKRRNPS